MHSADTGFSCGHTESAHAKSQFAISAPTCSSSEWKPRRTEDCKMELWQYDATDLAQLIRTGRASAMEAVDSVFGRLHSVNPAINAVVRVLEPEARAAAETADAARARGHALPPLHGVPVTIKINVDMAGSPTDNGVIPLKDLVAKEDSPVV